LRDLNDGEVVERVEDEAHPFARRKRVEGRGDGIGGLLVIEIVVVPVVGVNQLLDRAPASMSAFLLEVGGRDRPMHEALGGGWGKSAAATVERRNKSILDEIARLSGIAGDEIGIPHQGAFTVAKKPLHRCAPIGHRFPFGTGVSLN
jgi:hypothetical protein